MSKLWAFFVIRREDRMITLEEAKKYLRVDSGDEDDIIQQELDAAENLVAAVLRKDSLDDESSPITVVAVLYALACYEVTVVKG